MGPWRVPGGGFGTYRSVGSKVPLASHETGSAPLPHSALAAVRAARLLVGGRVVGAGLVLGVRSCWRAAACGRRRGPRGGAPKPPLTYSKNLARAEFQIFRFRFLPPVGGRLSSVFGFGKRERRKVMARAWSWLMRASEILSTAAISDIQSPSA